nr:collagen alpha-2(I) chain-like [Loxodonta africana]
MGRLIIHSPDFFQQRAVPQILGRSRPAGTRAGYFTGEIAPALDGGELELNCPLILPDDTAGSRSPENRPGGSDRSGGRRPGRVGSASRKRVPGPLCVQGGGGVPGGRFPTGSPFGAPAPSLAGTPPAWAPAPIGRALPSHPHPPRRWALPLPRLQLPLLPRWALGCAALSAPVRRFPPTFRIASLQLAGCCFPPSGRSW